MLGDAEPPRSNRRRLADKQACRLGLLGYLRRRLPWQTTAQVQSSTSTIKNKGTPTREVPLFFGGEGEI